MELGNALFGHSRGEYVVDRNGEACDLLNDLMSELGFDGYGRIREDVDAGDPTVKRILAVTARGVEVHGVQGGGTLLLTRSYWWGDDESPEAGLPNLEVPSMGFQLSWYKYMFRDAYSNRPLTVGLVRDFRRLLRAELEALAPYVRHPGPVRVDWTKVDGERPVDGVPRHVWCEGRAVCGPEDGVTYDHALVVDAPESFRGSGRFRAWVETPDGLCRSVAYFDALGDATAWCERRMRRWK